MASGVRIKFGTDGWRAVMAREFTFDNIRRVATAIAAYMRQAPHPAGGVAGDHGAIIGYDARFLSEEFAAEIAAVLAGAGIRATVVNRDCPTPVVAFSIRDRQAGGGVMLTASHNPPIYNGVKYIPHYARPALPEVTDAIEALVPAEAPGPSAPAASGMVDMFDPAPRYFEQLASVVRMDVLRDARLKVYADVLHSSGRGYLDEALRQAGCEVTLLNGTRNPLFGGSLPDPNAENLTEMARLVRESGAALGLATDGDADRFGIVDPTGEWVSPNRVLTLLYHYLSEHRGLAGRAAVRTVATTHQLDALARRHGATVKETAVGFKWVGAGIVETDAAIGGEESGGLTVAGHIAEKDGVLACLMVAEAVAVTGKSPLELLAEVDALTGPYVTDRIDIHLTEATRDELMRTLRESGLESVGATPVVERRTVDGVKLILEDESWILIRPSGTEPLVRCYMEARSHERLAELDHDLRAVVEQVVPGVHA